MTYILRGTENPIMSESRGVYPKKYEVNSHGDGTHGRELSWQFKSKLIYNIILLIFCHINSVNSCMDFKVLFSIQMFLGKLYQTNDNNTTSNNYNDCTHT